MRARAVFVRSCEQEKEKHKPLCYCGLGWERPLFLLWNNITFNLFFDRPKKNRQARPETGPLISIGDLPCSPQQSEVTSRATMTAVRDTHSPKNVPPLFLAPDPEPERPGRAGMPES